MTLLEAISPTARKLLAITKGERRKVHAPTEDHKPLCGGGGMAENQFTPGRRTSARCPAKPAATSFSNAKIKP